MLVRALLLFLLVISVGEISAEAKDRETVQAWGTVFAEGKPVPNATVVTCDSDTKVIAHNYRRKIAETTSNAKGRFVFDRLPLKKGEVYSLIAYAPGYAIGWYSHPNPKELHDVRIHLGKPTEHRGFIKDEQETPVEGAEVQVVILTQEFGRWGNRVSLSQEIGYGFAQTDRNGHFSIPNLPTGSGVYLLIDHPDYALQSQPTIPVGEQMTFHLFKGGSIQGRVYFKKTGKSPEPLTVLATPDVRCHNVPPPRDQVQTDEEGHFVFSHILPGNYYFLLPQSVPGWTYVAPYVKVEEGRNISDADIVLTPGGDIHGKVLYKEKPLADVEVRIFHFSQPPYTQGVKASVVYTDENGLYQAQVAHGEVDLLVIAPNGYPQRKTLNLREGEVLREINFELSNIPFVKILGKVQKPDGTPVPNATVLATPIQINSKTDGNGEFILRDITQGNSIVLDVSLSNPPMKRVVKIHATDDTPVIVTLMPVDDQFAQKAILTQDILKAAEKYKKILLRRRQLSLGCRESYPEVDPVRYPGKETHEYFQAQADVQEALTEYLRLTDDYDAFNSGGWINQAFSGMMKMSASAGSRTIFMGFTDEMIHQ